MLNRLFPKQFDNDYRGHRLAIWLFVPFIPRRNFDGPSEMWTFLDRQSQ